MESNFLNILLICQKLLYKYQRDNTRVRLPVPKPAFVFLIRYKTYTIYAYKHNNFRFISSSTPWLYLYFYPCDRACPRNFNDLYSVTIMSKLSFVFDRVSRRREPKYWKYRLKMKNCFCRRPCFCIMSVCACALNTACWLVDFDGLVCDLLVAWSTRLFVGVFQDCLMCNSNPSFRLYVWWYCKS